MIDCSQESEPRSGRLRSSLKLNHAVILPDDPFKNKWDIIVAS